MKKTVRFLKKQNNRLRLKASISEIAKDLQKKI